MAPGRWRPRELVELFVLANLAFLALDVYLAHLANHFRNWAEWIPVGFSVAAPILLLAAMIYGGLAPGRGFARGVGLAIGWAAILVGVAGLLLHLHSQFFELRTLKSLVYTAPFIAPLAYAGLGLLLILDRMVDAESAEWAGWVLLLALGGFLGNFILTLADHAQNNFFVRSEWVPVVAAAFATTFLAMPLMIRIGRGYLQICLWLMAAQVLVGLAGFGLHVAQNLRGPSPSLRDNFIYGAPAFAPLLFPNLAILAVLGLWAMRRVSAERVNLAV